MGTKTYRTKALINAGGQRKSVTHEHWTDFPE